MDGGVIINLLLQLAGRFMWLVPKAIISACTKLVFAESESPEGFTLLALCLNTIASFVELAKTLHNWDQLSYTLGYLSFHQMTSTIISLV